MRPGNLIPSLVVFAMTLAIGIYFIASFWDAMTKPYTTTITYAHTVSESTDLRGVLIRDEYTLPPVSGILDILRSEGEQVGVGQVVGRIYQDMNTLLAQNQVEQLIHQADVLSYALDNTMDILTVTKIDDEVIQALASLHSDVARGDFQQLESQITQVQGSVMRRDYIFGSPLEQKALEDRYDDLIWQVNNASSHNAQSVSQITSPVSGAYSILVDGLESYHIETINQLSVSELDQLLDINLPPVDEGAGKIITGNTWYFAATVAQEWVQDLREGNFVTLRFTGDFTQDISMKIQEISLPQQGKCKLILSSDRYLEQTTLLRFQTAELVYQTYSGIRIPKDALRMESYENRETGEITQVYGVYMVSAGYADFTPVEILLEASDYFLVSSIRTGAGSLRAGQEIIVHAVGIYDGQLLFY